MNIIELNFSRPSKTVPNFGIELLKTIIYFFVLVYHCYDKDKCESKILKIILDAIPIYYPTLFLIYFYFSYNHLSNKKIPEIRKRFLKLIVPYVVWPLFFYLLNTLSTARRTKKYTYQDLYTQLIIGRGIACVFWYQFNLIIINMIFCIIILLSKKRHLHILLSILITSYALEYFGVIEMLFMNYSDNVKRSVGRIFKMTAYSIIGYIISSIRVLISLKNHRELSMCISLCVSIIIIYFKLYLSEIYFYEGLFTNIGIISIFIFFYMLPFELITFGPLVFLIKQITSYSSGIYYLHIKILDYFKDTFYAFEEKTLIGCALNYIICYSICFIGMKIFGKSYLKYLFIR